MAASSRLPLTTGGRIVAVTGVLFLLDTFAPWHRTCVGVLDVRVCKVDTAWATSFSTLAALLVAVLLAELVAVRTGRVRLPDLGQMDWGQLRLAVSAAAFGLVVLQLLMGDGALDRGYGIWVGAALSAALTYGNHLRVSETSSISGRAYR